MNKDTDVKREISEENKEFLEEIEKSEDEKIFQVYNLIGINGNPRFREGQEFYLEHSADKENKETDVNKNVVVELEKVIGRTLKLKSKREFQNDLFPKDLNIDLLSLNEKRVTFKVNKVDGKRLFLDGLTFQNVFLNIEKEEK